MKIPDKVAAILDCEGPLATNDNAQESVVEFALRCGLGAEVGTRFYQRMSVIDDLWGDHTLIQEDPHYSAGHTLKVVLPFLKAMGATSESLTQFAGESVRLVPGIGEVLPRLAKKYLTRIISTSYRFFIDAFCGSIGFDPKWAYCTEVKGFDDIRISEREKGLLLRFMEKVADMPVIEYDLGTGEILGVGHQRCFDEITGFVWKTIFAGMEAGDFLRLVHPVGQRQKAETLFEISCREGLGRDRILYVGDSQTDVLCLQYIKGGGLSLVFNGKGMVCQYADLMYAGEHAGIIEEVADRFSEVGRGKTLCFYASGCMASGGGTVASVTAQNVKALEEASLISRAKLRGDDIAALT